MKKTMRRCGLSLLMASILGTGLAASQRVVHSVYRATLPCEDCSSHNLELTLYGPIPNDAGDTRFSLKETFVFVVLASGERGVDREEESSGIWAIASGRPSNPESTVYLLNPDKPGETRYFLSVRGQELQEHRGPDSTATTELVSFRRMPTDAEATVGGYVTARVGAPDVRAAAEFAVMAETARTGKALVLVRIISAEQQIVSGLHFRFCLGVSAAGAPESRVLTTVYRDLNGHLVLSHWAAGGCS